MPPTQPVRRASEVIDLTGNDSGAEEEEHARKRRRVSLPTKDPNELLSPTLSLAALAEQVSGLESNLAATSAGANANADPEVKQLDAPNAHVQALEEDEDEEDDDRDEDGLVRIDFCLKVAYEEKAGQIWCKMCE